jgi:hypothetical protein
MTGVAAIRLTEYADIKLDVTAAEGNNLAMAKNVQILQLH